MKQIDFKRKDSKRCAVCHNATHRGFLTAKAVMEHNCVGKNCPYLEKLDHRYWTQCERKSLEKKVMKLMMELKPLMFKDDCYKAVKEMDIIALRRFVELGGWG